MPRPQLPPPDEDQSFGARVIRYRLKQGLSRQQLAAELLGVAPITPKSIQRWENEGLLPRNPHHYVEVMKRLHENGI